MCTDTRKTANKNLVSNISRVPIWWFWNSRSWNYWVPFMYSNYKTVQSEERIYLIQCYDWLYFQVGVLTCSQRFYDRKLVCHNKIYIKDVRYFISLLYNCNFNFCICCFCCFVVVCFDFRFFFPFKYMLVLKS